MPEAGKPGNLFSPLMTAVADVVVAGSRPEKRFDAFPEKT